ncbi:hypothetical protein FOZ62_026161 [Perkinsus olseni]|uniref:Uncharacterized protein n=1 Tax=Perkinsus olseni TaxID=32597 RepID=A0A7J6QY08_PEROL|nr:hypothetical protein FOZ62_026161 [Perkinsus olseni]
MAANQEELSAVDTVLTNVSQASPAAVNHLDALKRAVDEFGLSSLTLFAAADATAIGKIAARVSPGTTDAEEATASLLRGVLRAAVKNANAQLEILQLRDVQVERGRKTPALDLAKLSDRGRKEVDFGTLFSYMAHVCAAFEEHPYQAVIQAESKYRRTGAMAVASGIAPMYSSELSAFYALQASVRKHHLQRVRVSTALVRSARIFLDLLQQPAMASTTAAQLLGWVTPADSGAVVVADASLTGLGGVVFSLPSTTLTYDPDAVEWFHVTYADEPLVKALVPSDLLTSSDIGPLELLASVIGVVRALNRGFTTVTVLSDNVATVACINRRRAKSARMNDTMKRLRLEWPSLGYSVASEHIQGELNHLADFLSRSSTDERGTFLQAFGREVDAHSVLQQLVLALS